MIFRFAVAVLTLAALDPRSAWALAAKPLAGQYNCYEFSGNPPAAKFVGSFFLDSGNAYQVKDQPVAGKYNYDGEKRMITWGGAPPLGYEVGIVEQPDRYNPPKLRLFPKKEDLGNMWKAAVCSFQAVGKGGGAAAPPPSDTSASYTVGAKVFVLTQGELMPAVITAVDAGRYSVRYEPNRYGLRTDTVPPARLRPRS